MRAVLTADEGKRHTTTEVQGSDAPTCGASVASCAGRGGLSGRRRARTPGT